MNDGMFHERCHCNLPLQSCKTYCDQDPNCKGYVQSWNDEKCDYATTSNCKQSCSKFDHGKVGSLGGTCEKCAIGAGRSLFLFSLATKMYRSNLICGRDYGGCYVKQSGMTYY